MHDIQKRWVRYRTYGRSHGLSDEAADDFAQDAYIRFLEAGKEIALRFVYVDHMRATKGRYKNRTMTRLRDAAGEASWMLGPALERILAEAPVHKMTHHAVMKRLARYFSVTLKEMKEILEATRES